MKLRLYLVLVALTVVNSKKLRHKDLPRPAPFDDHHAEPGHSNVEPLYNATALGHTVEKHSFLAALFYAPWCGHCRQLMPQWTDASVMLRESSWSDIKMVKLDMTRATNVELRTRYGIRGYPSLKLFKAHSPLPYEYRGPRDSEGIAAYLIKERERCSECGSLEPATEGADAGLSEHGFL